MAADIRRVARELAALLGLDMQALRATYRELFGEEGISHDAATMRRWIARWISCARSLEVGGREPLPEALGQRAPHEVAQLGHDVAVRALDDEVPRRSRFGPRRDRVRGRLAFEKERLSFE
jgi:hypothetical protein